MFEWYTLEPLPDTIIEINTTPQQVQVLENGTYSLNVPEGDYNIVAQYFEDNRLKYEGSETIHITEDGNFNLDIIVFPSLRDDDYMIGDFNALDLPAEPAAQQSTEQDILGFALPVIGIILLFAAILYGGPKLLKKITGLETERFGIEEKVSREAQILGAQGPQIPTSVNSQNAELDKDLRQTLEILKNGGGRMTQKELREKIPQYGEAKISLMVAELEHMGLVKKFKKGRGNVIVLKK